MNIKVAIQTIRPPFLILTPICVFLGLIISLVSQSSVNFTMFFIILIGAIFAHISVNTLNEYFDFKSGLDLKTEKTPFSGGSGGLPSCPSMAKTILMIGLVSLLITIGVGFYFVYKGVYLILPIGFIGVILVATYTQWINRSPLICLVAPGIGFGVLMVVGTHVILAGEHTLSPWLISIAPFLLINNLLLLNQYPDMKADASVGRNTLPIAYGIKKSNLVYAAFMLLAYLSIIVLMFKGYLPALSWVALMPLLLSLFSLKGLVKWGASIGEHPHYMAANVAAAIITPLLLGLSIING
jgi:1,4-dihydroxy-2-naphthoate octaprenyltransferase